MIPCTLILTLMLGRPALPASQDAAEPATSAADDPHLDDNVTFERTESAIRVLIDGELFTALTFGDVQKPYLFPVIGPGDTFITRGYPMEHRPGEAKDHDHHTSLWFAHGDVNGHDFWHGGHGERIVHVRSQLPGEQSAGQNVAAAESSLAANEMSSVFEWRAPDGQAVCTERRTMQFEGSHSVRAIDMDITLTAGEQPITFGDTKEGTFALRLAPTLRLTGDVAQGRARNSSGANGDDVWGKRAKWIEYEGPIDDRRIGVAVFDHPENPRHPTWWHARPYGLLAANAFGRQAFEGRGSNTGERTLDAAQSVRFRYRIVIHEGSWDAERLDSEYTRWTRSP